MVRRNLGNGGNTLSLSVATQRCSSEEEEEDMANTQKTGDMASAERPPLVSYQSNSLPSTPQLRSREGPTRPRSPQLGRNVLNISPRSSPADQRHPIPAQRRLPGGCKYETGMARARRRVPYSLGPDKLGPEDGTLKTQLNPEEDEKLSGDMRELYDRLLPSPESEERRRIFIQKLEKLLKEKWPEQKIDVNVFGSTGNNLGTSDSDVDICLTTDWRELEHVCSLAELLANNGMEKVVCVSSAKVPIVKVWDPELEIACDMNVNNPIALENTELIRAYVGLDPRVRPLAMMIKHWAKRRILNDAALGGTLSSYTWICMILNFLQTRNPPILPSLQQQPRVPPKIVGGVNVAFDRQLKAHCSFGAKNTDSLGSLVFQFFRYYAHELDFEHSVMSVRLGKVITKSEKGWHLLQDNRLCIEEPFNTARNLANTADDTSMRGIHIELRRAFRKLSEGDLKGCCEQYIRPQEEGRSSEIFLPPPISRPVIPRAPAQTMKAPKNGNKGPRHTNGSNNRGQNNAGRRTSIPISRGGYLRNLPFPMTTQELQMQQQHQQHVLHDELFRQYQYLQMQEQELRMQLQLQALSQGRLATSNSYPHIAFPSHPASENGHDENQSSSTQGNYSTMSAPLRQQRFGYPSPYLPTASPNYGMITNPSSPLLASAMPDMTRYPRRTSVTRSSAAASSRAHSQPARSQQSPIYMQSAQGAVNPMMAIQASYVEGTRSSVFSNGLENSSSYVLHEQAALQYRQSSARRPAEYMGHYIGPSPPIPAYSRSAGISPVPSQVGLAIQNGGLSPGFFPRMNSYSPPNGSPPSQPLSDSGEDVDQTRPHGLSSPLRLAVSSKKGSSGPLVVDGSMSGHFDLEYQENEGREQELPAALSASASEDLAFDTPSSSDDQCHDQVAPATGGSLHQGNDLHREVTPTGRLESLKSKHMSDQNMSPMTVSAHIAGLKSPTYKVRDPLSPVREDPIPPQFPDTANEVSCAANAAVLSPSMKRIVLPEIPSYASLRLKKQETDALFSRTNGILASYQPVAETASQPKTATVPAALQNVWQMQGKKKKAKKSTEGGGQISLFNGYAGENSPKKAVERKGG